MPRAIGLRERLAAEELLRQQGLDEGAARKLGGWLARLAPGPSSPATRSGAAARSDALAAVVRGGLDPATLSPQELQALCVVLRMLRPHDERGLALTIAAHAELGAGTASEPLRAALAGRAAVPGPRRPLADAQLTTLGVRQVEALATSDDTTKASSAARALAAAARAGHPAIRDAAASAHGRLRSRALAALDRTFGELDAAQDALDAPLAARVAVLQRACAIDAEIGHDIDLQRRLLERWLPLAWRSYTLRRWDELRALLAVVNEVVDRLAADLSARPDELAYRASVAQALVFRSEMAPTLAGQIELGERALAMCPTLRNARVVLAAHLVDRARRSGGAAARQDAKRALELDPHSEAAQKLARP